MITVEEAKQLGESVSAKVATVCTKLVSVRQGTAVQIGDVMDLIEEQNLSHDELVFLAAQQVGDFLKRLNFARKLE